MITVELTVLEAALIARLLLLVPDESILVGTAEGIAEKMSIALDEREAVGI
jgi:hypothetical protein